MSLEEKLKNISYKEEEIGNIVKASKIYYKWEFDYKYTTYMIEMWDSKLTGKKRVKINGELSKEIEE